MGLFKSELRLGLGKALVRDGVFRPILAVVLSALALVGYLQTSPELLLVIAGLGPPLILVAPRSNRVNSPKRDADTGLIDKNSLTRAIDTAFLPDKTAGKMACIAIAIDDPKALRGDWGVDTYHRAILETIDRIKTTLRSDDLLARLSDTELAVFVPSLRAPETSAVLALCDRMTEVTRKPIVLDGLTIDLTLSAGFCLSARAPAPTGVALLDAAQLALAEARQSGPSGVRSFSKNTHAAVVSDFSDEALAALRDGQIQTWFQPQVSSDTGSITGFEALARWDHPKRGTLLPQDFVHLFEASNKMEEFSENILAHALKALVGWDQSGLIIPSVSVNFATQELRNPSLVERIKWDVDTHGLEPSRLTVEVLETVILQTDDDIITRNIRALGSQGFRIDLDDFGTGHASLSNINRFAVDRVKIDRSFVARADTDPEQQRMIAAIVGLCERLGIETLAEGVETTSELSLLSQLGCNHLQGFAISKPMPFDQTLAWVEARKATLPTPQIISKKLQ